MYDTLATIAGALMFIIPLFLLNWFGMKYLPPTEAEQKKAGIKDNAKGGRLEFIRHAKTGKDFYGQTIVNSHGIELAYLKNKQIALGEQYPEGVFGVYVEPKGIKVMHFPIIGGKTRVIDKDQVPEEIKQFALEFHHKLSTSTTNSLP